MVLLYNPGSMPESYAIISAHACHAARSVIRMLEVSKAKAQACHGGPPPKAMPTGRTPRTPRPPMQPTDPPPKKMPRPLHKGTAPKWIPPPVPPKTAPPLHSIHLLRPAAERAAMASEDGRWHGWDWLFDRVTPIQTPVCLVFEPWLAPPAASSS